MDRCDHGSKDCTCPFAVTEAAEEVRNYGCLPTTSEIMRLRTVCGKSWACHGDITKPCVGAIRALKDAGLPYKYEGGLTLVSELEFEDYYPLIQDARNRVEQTRGRG